MPDPSSDPVPDPVPDPASGLSPDPPLAETAPSGLAGAAAILRGVRRGLAARGFIGLPEFRLASGRRADLLAMDAAGTVLIVEVKSGVPDFRSDQKWPDYLDWCDAFYFAVDADFPEELIPEDCGLLVADAYGAELLREAPRRKLAPARRKTLLLRAALTGAARLHRVEDPGFSQADLAV